MCMQYVPTMLVNNLELRTVFNFYSTFNSMIIWFPVHFLQDSV